jgi:hypothetical protein
MDLRLLCRIGPTKVLSSAFANQSQVVGMTQNLSRCGMLMLWQKSVELPAIGSPLTVDIDLPADESFGPRLMRCGTTVVRIIPSATGESTVGMRIRNIRFVAPKKAVGSTGETAESWALETLPPASLRLN